ncbi:MAG: IS30 family transposase [Coxiellaceae bacterium]|nr:IS30 family transposase [Coxiellaceae bacterium]
MPEKKYKQLSRLQRVLLSTMLRKGYSKSKIATNLGVHRPTIYREINRNSWISASKVSYYTPQHAQGKYIRRRKKKIKLLGNKTLRQYVESRLLSGWSPWQIEGRLKYENQGRSIISHETIYRYIYSDYGIRNRFYKKLRRKHFSRVKHGSRKKRYPADIMISNRSDAINNRSVFGHWEGDLMIFKRGIRGNLITLRERKSRLLVAVKNNDKSAKGTAINIISTLKNIKDQVKSITFDQGSEFMKYPWIKDCLEADIATEEGRAVIKEHVGDRKIDVLVNNAGLMEPAGLLSELPLDKWRYQYGVNLEAPLFLSQLLLNNLSGGRILNITIYSSFRVTPGLAAYGISKAALNMLTEYMRAEFKELDVSVGLLLPGIVNTGIQDQYKSKSISNSKPPTSAISRLEPTSVSMFIKWLILDSNKVEFGKDIWDIYDKKHQKFWHKGEPLKNPLL